MGSIVCNSLNHSKKRVYNPIKINKRFRWMSMVKRAAIIQSTKRVVIKSSTNIRTMISNIMTMDMRSSRLMSHSNTFKEINIKMIRSGQRGSNSTPIRLILVNLFNHRNRPINSIIRMH
jgi:flagellar biosynthesis component FlhA